MEPKAKRLPPRLFDEFQLIKLLDSFFQSEGYVSDEEKIQDCIDSEIRRNVREFAGKIRPSRDCDDTVFGKGQQSVTDCVNEKIDEELSRLGIAEKEER